MGIANALTYRATITREVVIGTDPYGNDQTEQQIIGTQIPCKVWTKNASVSYNETTNIYERAIVCAFLKSADVKNGDRLEVSNSCGAVVYQNLEVVNNPWIREHYIEAPVRWIE